MSNDPSPTLARPPRGWPLFLAGLALFVLGPVIYGIQLSRGETIMPWYLPILATVGVLLMALSVWRRRSVLRTIGVVLFLALAGLEWAFFTTFTRMPDYTGAARTGTKIPAFETTLADGRSFTTKDVETGEPTVLLFNRGHW